MTDRCVHGRDEDETPCGKPAEYVCLDHVGDDFCADHICDSCGACFAHCRCGDGL